MPELPILLITDPINTFYGGRPRDFFEELKDAGIEVIETNLDALPDSNPTYSVFYRGLAGKFSSVVGKKVPNILDLQGQKVPLQSYTRMLNFKANHRKVVLNEKEAVVSSANPHDASAPNHNFGVRVSGAVVNDLLNSEKAVYRFSAPGKTFFDGILHDPIPKDPTFSNAQVRLLTEEGIRRGILEILGSARAKEKICIGIFYFSDRLVINAVKNACTRGVNVQIIMDKNIDAFGQKKNGLPNLPVAFELVKAGATVKWAVTHGEQYHPKYIALIKPESIEIIAGSGNFTRRNIGNFNLETSLWAKSSDLSLRDEFLAYWNRQWCNQDAEFTQNINEYKQPKSWHRLLYLLQEKSGLSTF